MNVPELRYYAENLGHFASIREGATPPSDRIAIQKRSGGLKFAASMFSGTIIIDAGEDDGVGPEGVVFVPARIFLTAVKAMRGKGDVTIDLDDNGNATLNAPEPMGSLEIPSTDDTVVPTLYRPPALGIDAVRVSKGFWSDSAKVLTVFSGSAFGGYRQVWLEVNERGASFRSGDHAAATEVLVKSAEGSFFGSINPDFINGVRGLEKESIFWWSPDYFVVTEGNITAVSPFQKDFPRYPLMPTAEGPHRGGIISNKDATSGIKSVIENDEYGRVTLWDNEGDIAIHSFKQDVDEDEVLVSGDRLLKILGALGGNEIAISWDENKGPLWIKGGTHEFALARVVL